jgi:hypothetical protein
MGEFVSVFDFNRFEENILAVCHIAEFSATQGQLTTSRPLCFERNDAVPVVLHADYNPAVFFRFVERWVKVPTLVSGTPCAGP